MANDDKRIDEAGNSAEFFELLIKLVRKHQQLITQVAVSNAALLQAVLERFPELADSYERYRLVSERDSPFAQTSRQLTEELDRLIAATKKDS